MAQCLHSLRGASCHSFVADFNEFQEWIDPNQRCFKQIRHRFKQIRHRFKQIRHRFKQIRHRFKQIRHRFKQIRSVSEPEFS